MSPPRRRPGGRATGPSPRAQVSPGRFVVLVLMVVVASIASGLLVESFGLLALVDDPDDQSDGVRRLVVVGATGTGIEDGAVGRAEFVVRPGPDSGAVDLRNVTLTWVGPDGTYDLVDERSTRDADGRFSVAPVGDAAGAPTVLAGPDERAVLTVGLGGAAGDVPSPIGRRLSPGDAVLVTVVSADGPPTYVRLDVPPVVGRDAVAL